MMAPDVYQDTLDFTSKLGGALATYGAPAHRIEDVLRLLTQDLGVDGTFSATPSIILMEFQGPTGRDLRIERVYANHIDLTRLRRLDRLFNQVADKRLSPREGSQQLEAIVQAPPRFGPGLDLVAYALTAAAATPMFGGSLTDAALGLIAGAAVGLAARVVPDRLLVPTGGFVAALSSAAFAPIFGAVNVDAATLGGVIVLVPGFTLTLGVSELVTHNVTAGVSRLGAALITALSLSFGVIFGRATGDFFTDLSTLTPGTPAPLWVSWVMLPIAVITINILFRAPLRQWGWILLTSSLTFGATQFSAQLVRPEFTVFVGGLTLGIASNIYARTKDLPAAIIRMPGLLFLVPGSLSFLSIQAVMSGHMDQATTTLGQLTLVAISLVMGLIMAGSLVPPRKAL
jgi:uncharacterized membrane protein YjjP (DUF1212 family)